MNTRYKSFIFGCLFYTGLRMFYQEMMGLEKYIVYVKSTWIEMSPLWGLATMVIAIIFFSIDGQNHD